MASSQKSRGLVRPSRLLARRVLRFGLRFTNAAETEVVRSGVEFSFAPSTFYVARAVLVGAQKRTSALHRFRTPGSLTSKLSAGLWDHRDLSADCQGLVIVGPIPIGCPLPHIARHIQQTIPVGWKGAHWSGCQVPFFAGIGVREVPLEGYSPCACHRA
jgi:hypothetical protein